MKKFLAIFFSAVCLAASAVSAPEHDNSFVSTSDGDTLMPTLAELLGEDIDNFGDFDASAALKEELVGYASRYLGTRYKGGGKGPGGFDCSGFTSYVFRNFGYELFPASRMQCKQGVAVDFSELEVGDLMFFSGRRGGATVGHVGMVVDVDRENGTCRFIHASSSQGIVIQKFPDGGYYSRRYLHARRVLGEMDQSEKASR